MVNDLCGNPNGVFKGYYITDAPENVVKVYSFFSGLGLPENRITGLKKEIAELQTKINNKSEQRNLSLQLDTGKSDTCQRHKK